MGSFHPGRRFPPRQPTASARRVTEARVAFSGRRRAAVTTVTVKDDASPGQKRKARAVEDIDDDDLEPATAIAPSPPRLTPEEEAELRERRGRDARARAARRVRAVRRAAAASGAAGDAGGTVTGTVTGWRPRWETPTTKHSIKFRDVSAESVVAVRSATADMNRAAARFKNQHGGAAKVTTASSFLEKLKNLGIKILLIWLILSFFLLEAVS